MLCVENMKQSKKCYLVLVVPLLILIVIIFISNQKVVKNQDDVKKFLYKELQLKEDDGSIISYAGEFSIYGYILYWFSIQNQYERYYRAVECSLLSCGRYKVRKVYKPMIYAKDIVHVVWMAKDIFLINNPNCRFIICEDVSGDNSFEISLSPSDLPYVYLNEPPFRKASTDFVDLDGNSVR